MKIIKVAGKSVEELKGDSVEWSVRLKEIIERDGGKISDFRIKEMAKAEFMTNVLRAIDMGLYFVQTTSVKNELEKVKSAVEGGQTLTAQDLQPLYSRFEELQIEIEKVKSFVKDAKV